MLCCCESFVRCFLSSFIWLLSSLWLVLSCVLLGLCMLILLCCCFKCVYLCISWVDKCLSCVNLICNLFFVLEVCRVKILRIRFVWLIIWYLSLCLRFCFWVGDSLWLKIIRLELLVDSIVVIFWILFLFVKVLGLGFCCLLKILVVIILFVDLVRRWIFFSWFFRLGWLKLSWMIIVCFMVVDCLVIGIFWE